VNSQPLPEPDRLASELDAELRSLPRRSTPETRRVRQSCSRRIRSADPGYVLAFARSLFHQYSRRWVAYEILAGHKAAFQRLGPAEMEEFGRGIDSWWSVDAFARTLSGPAWLAGQLPDRLILAWAHSPDLWWRRAALVSTVALNMRSLGGWGDVPRTLVICRLLAGDHEDMIEKALSWALRELVVHDRNAVLEFLEQHHADLGARVKREVMNKIRTGLKNPR
jgi:3-methyladenine DNA glycosylase AlkD